MAAITKIENMSVKTSSFNLFLCLYPKNTNLISNFKSRAFAPQKPDFFNCNWQPYKLRKSLVQNMSRVSDGFPDRFPDGNIYMFLFDGEYRYDG